jgi:hypothetical protein
VSYRAQNVLVVGLLVGFLCRGLVAANIDPDMFKTPVYIARDDAIARHNGDRFNNRPLYCNQITGIVLTGDRPLVRLGNGPTLSGTFIVALARGDHAKWLHEFSDVTAAYRADRMQWSLRDSDFGTTAITLDATPLAQGAGAVVRLSIENAQPGDRLIWACGGNAEQKSSMQYQWDLTTGAWSNDRGPRQKQMELKLLPTDCLGNRVSINGDMIQIQRDARGGIATTLARCSAPSHLLIADADAWNDPLKLIESAASKKPLACGVVNLDGVHDVYWSMAAAKDDGASLQSQTPADAFTAGLKRAQDLQTRVTVDTPDARLNAEVAVSNAVMDGVFREGVFTHAGMRWGVPLLGWRTVYGGTAFGWHDRVKTQAALAFAKIITQSDNSEPQADPDTGLSSQSPDSMMFGKGRVDFHQPHHYDMQTQFFDQMIHAWRWTGDAELEKSLRPALEYHLDYIHECFDPSDCGLYESYANTWPTDDQWYNGGGTAEETAYAYNAEKAAVELAQRAHDPAGVKKHQARVDKIFKALHEKLWVKNLDYVGAYVEQGGHERLHPDCWLYAIFCPIDAGMLSIDQAAQSLYYTEWGLERDDMPYGGQRVWTSNWVPSKWSLREMWPGDCYATALAYFQTGLADDGWNLLRGTFPAMAFYGPTPGDLGHPNGGTDFNDCASMFCRTIVEGLFGYRPDYPNGVVTISPQLPAEWDHASIKTPDFSLKIAGYKYEIHLNQPAELKLQLPVRARKLTEVLLNGHPAHFDLQPGFGCTVAVIDFPATSDATVELHVEQPLPQYPAVALETSVGQTPDLSIKDAQIVQPAVVPQTRGYHLVDELVRVGDLLQRRLFKIKVNDPAADAAEASETFDKPPADAQWEALDISPQFNGDIRTIFKQQYLSPRPNTCSLRLAVDGYSTWQEMIGSGGKPGKSKAPDIDLTNVPSLRKQNAILTTSGIPFAWHDGDKNIAFTSMWNNWPHQITFPINRRAQGICFLLCGFTNPMQCRIANAELRLNYSDGSVQKVEIVPPINFWSLCPFGGSDYDYTRDAFSLPRIPPTTLQLGNNCRAIVLNVTLHHDATLQSVTLETLSQEVIIGLMGQTLLNAK